MTSDQVLSFFASVRDHVIAFLGRLFDRSLPFVEGAWNWVKENP
jgi:hypothetical protein